MKIAFIGAGNVNFGGIGVPWDHSKRLEKLQNVEIVAIVDPLVEKASQVLASKKNSSNGHLYKECEIFENIHALLASPVKPEAVLLGTLPFTRGSFEKGKDLELKLAEAGIHIFCEKPLTILTPEDFEKYSRTVSDVVQRNKTIFSVGYMFRYHPAVLKMKDIIKQHGGKVMSLEARYYHAHTQDTPPLWWDVSKCGGPIVEQATHFCDVARFLAGDVDESTMHTLCVREEDPGGAGIISGVASCCEESLTKENKAPRVTMSHWRFKQGGLGSLIHTIALHGNKYETSIDVQMDGLRLTLHEPYEPECVLRVRDIFHDEPMIYPYGDCDPYQAELEAFVEAINTGNESLIGSSYADATETLNMTWAIRRAEAKIQ